MSGAWTNDRLTTLIVPTGATVGPRIVIDGVNGDIFVYNAANNLIGVINSDTFTTGVTTLLPGFWSGMMDGVNNDRYIGFELFTNTPAVRGKLGTSGGINFQLGSMMFIRNLGAPNNEPQLIIRSPLATSQTVEVDDARIHLTTNSTNGAVSRAIDMFASTVTMSDKLAVTNTITSNNKQVPLGYIEYGNVTAGSVATSTGTEVAIPAASWAHEPNMTFVNGRIYKLEAQYGYGILASGNNGSTIRVRKGSATVAGQVLGNWTVQETSSAIFADRTNWCIIQNVSGANITSALSLTIQRISGTASNALFGDTGCILQVTVQDLGLASGHTLSSIATSIV